MAVPFDVVASLAQAVRELQAPQDLEATLDAILLVARDSMPGIAHIGISLAHRDGRIETRAATDDLVRELDRLQYAGRSGPGLHAIDADTIVRVEHARHEQRWPAYITPAVALGLRSQLGVRLPGTAGARGVLNMYSLTDDTISAETEQLAELFAVHVALVLGHAERIDNLNAALASRRLIGIALGIIMQRLDVDEDQAFAYLTRISASSEVKLRDVAGSVVEEHVARVRSGPAQT